MLILFHPRLLLLCVSCVDEVFFSYTLEMRSGSEHDGTQTLNVVSILLFVLHLNPDFIEAKSLVLVKR